MDQYAPIIVPVTVAVIFGIWKLLSRGIQWIAHEISENVVRSIGDTLSVRWKADMDAALEYINAELTDNGGSSLKDKVGDIDDRLQDIESQLEQEFNWRPRRKRHYDENDAYPA